MGRKRIQVRSRVMQALDVAARAAHSVLVVVEGAMLLVVTLGGEQCRFWCR